MADKYISPFQEERDLIETYGWATLRDLWSALPDLGQEESSKGGGFESNPKVKTVIEAAKESNDGSFQKLKAKKEIDIIKAEDVLLQNLLNAAPDGSPIKTDINRFELVLFFASDIDPSLFCLTSPADIKPKPNGDYLLLVYQKAYVQFINRTGIDLRDDNEKIKWRIPKEYMPPSWTDEERQAVIKARINRTVFTPEFDPNLKVDELNEDLSKFSYPKVERIEPKGWEPDSAIVKYFQLQSGWLSDAGSEEEESKFRKDIKRAYNNIVEAREEPPLWIKIVQTAEEFEEISIRNNQPANTTRKAIKDWLLDKDEDVSKMFSLLESGEDDKKIEMRIKNKWDDNFRSARQLVYITEAVRS